MLAVVLWRACQKLYFFGEIERSPFVRKSLRGKQGACTGVSDFLALTERSCRTQRMSPTAAGWRRYKKYVLALKIGKYLYGSDESFWIAGAD